jgi:hypothetical protein
MNGQLGEMIYHCYYLHQDDPLLPMLFILVKEIMNATQARTVHAN